MRAASAASAGFASASPRIDDGRVGAEHDGVGMRRGGRGGFGLGEPGDRVLGLFARLKLLVDVDGKHVEWNAGRAQQIRAPRRAGSEDEAHRRRMLHCGTT